jgi:hypothetical protein
MALCCPGFTGSDKRGGIRGILGVIRGALYLLTGVITDSAPLLVRVFQDMKDFMKDLLKEDVHFGSHFL